jgi:hypothetical protein
VGRAKFTAAWIDYGEIGRVGFVVQDGAKQVPPGALSAGAADFVMLQ